MKKAYIHTFGCKVNQYDSQVIRDSFRSKGYEFCPDFNEVDVVIVNSCTVTSEADRQCRQLIRKVLRKNKKAKVLVTGCYPVRSSREIKDISDRIEILPKTSSYNSGKEDKIGINKFEGRSRAFVKIQDGCSNFCSYCIVPFVRPKLWSRPEEEVVNEVKNLLKQGYREVVLTGVHLGNYEYGLVNILEKIIGLNDDFRIRLSSIDVGGVTDELLGLMKSNPAKICAHLHIPLQSGSNDILKKMKRTYNSEFYQKAVEKVYASLPDAGVTTDVMVGFPGETDKDFDLTYNLINRLKLTRLHVFRFSPRPGTLAAGFDNRVPENIIKERSNKLKALDKKLQETFWRRFIGKSRLVVMEGKSKTAITDNYIRIFLDSDIKAKSGIFKVEIFERMGKPWGKLSEVNEPVLNQ
ncbi:MAG: MiaB/RimO family radical SAM methylthiotransferase [Endomicrobiales bacterium]|nr:MiaB/RimO family radical SAM methylthiotransferase [Endomicrobiales bacterium]